MTDWTFAVDNVLEDRDGQWWHVQSLWSQVGGDMRMYELADATHTESRYLNAEDVEGWDGEDGMFTAAGWSTSTKPATVEGYRVNGVLCGPSGVEHWKGTNCLHDQTCPECGADGSDEIDVIHSHERGEVVEARCHCYECTHTWVNHE